MYGERTSRLDGVVVWTSADRGEERRILPDGCMDLIWLDGQLVVAGPDTRAHVLVGRPGARYAGLRFAPGRGPAVLGVPAHGVRDLRVPLGELWPGAVVRRFTERVGEAVATGGAAGAGRALESIAAARMRDATVTVPDPAVPAIVHAVERGLTVSAVARSVGIGERQLHRRCLAAFGYGPKTLARVLRLRRALALARAGTPFAEVAALAGHADQAHLAREVKALTGVRLGLLVRQEGLRPGDGPDPAGSGSRQARRPVQRTAAGSGANSSTSVPSGSRTMA